MSAKETLNPSPGLEDLSSASWVEEVIDELEKEARKMVLATLLHAGDKSRSLLFAILASLRARPGAEPPLASPTGSRVDQSPQLFSYRSLESFILSYYGRVEGLRGAILRTRGQPLSCPQHYFRLVGMLNDNSPLGRRRSVVLRHSKTVTSELIELLHVLPADLLHPVIVPLVGSLENAHRLRQILEFTGKRCSRRLGFHEIVALIRRNVDSEFDSVLTDLLLRHCDRMPPGPLAEDPFFEHVDTGPKFSRVGRAFRNCLAGQIVQAADGRAAYYLAATTPPAIVEVTFLEIFVSGEALETEEEPLSPRPQFWLTGGIHIAGRKPVPENVRMEVRQALARHGIGILRQALGSGVSGSFAEHLRHSCFSLPEFQDLFGL